MDGKNVRSKTRFKTSSCFALARFLLALIGGCDAESEVEVEADEEQVE